MKKKLLLATMLFTAIFQAQSTEALQKKIYEINLKIDHLYTEMQAIKTENLYYKKTLDINRPINQGIENNLEFTIINVTGNRKDKTLAIVYLYKNVSEVVRSNYQALQAYIVDDRGNQINAYDILANTERGRVEQVQPGIPMKGFIKFKIEDINFPIIKLLDLQFAYVGENHAIGQDVIFKDLPVIWQ